VAGIRPRPGQRVGGALMPKQTPRPGSDGPARGPPGKRWSWTEAPAGGGNGMVAPFDEVTPLCASDH